MTIDCWKRFLLEESKKNYYKQIKDFVTKEYQTKTIYPSVDRIFRAFALTPLADVRVVILGQDPYHNGLADGLAFSTDPGNTIPASLRNVFKEMKSDIGQCPANGDLSFWAKQGVLLLNTSLTVEAGKANSHAHIGWTILTMRALRTILSMHNRSRRVIFLLWGSYANQASFFIDESHHTVLRCGHPSPFSYNRSFKGCRHFSSVNFILKEHGHSPIQWYKT